MKSVPLLQISNTVCVCVCLCGWVHGWAGVGGDGGGGSSGGGVNRCIHLN